MTETSEEKSFAKNEDVGNKNKKWSLNYHELKILHTAFLYSTGLGSSSISCNSVLSHFFDTARMLTAFQVISIQVTRVFFVFVFKVLRAGN